MSLDPTSLRLLEGRPRAELVRIAVAAADYVAAKAASDAVVSRHFPISVLSYADAQTMEAADDAYRLLLRFIMAATS